MKWRWGLVLGWLLIAPRALAQSEPVREPPLVMPVLAFDLGASDSGVDAGLRLGVKVGFARLSLLARLGGGPPGRGHIFLGLGLGAVHWLTASVGLLGEVAVGHMSYGYLADDPVFFTTAVLPSAGLMFGANHVGFVSLTVGAVLANDRSTDPTVHPPSYMANLSLGLL
jgi:hypothetical protein